jgi:hypothetical protein
VVDVDVGMPASRSWLHVTYRPFAISAIVPFAVGASQPRAIISEAKHFGCVNSSAVNPEVGVSLGGAVAKGKLLRWGQGRRSPTGPTQVPLAMIDKRPSLVAELLR